jgi:hypothetical protein
MELLISLLPGSFWGGSFAAGQFSLEKACNPRSTHRLTDAPPVPPSTLRHIPLPGGSFLAKKLEGFVAEG